MHTVKVQHFTRPSGLSSNSGGCKHNQKSLACAGVRHRRLVDRGVRGYKRREDRYQFVTGSRATALHCFAGKAAAVEREIQEGSTNLPWHLIPKFSPGETDVNEHTRRLDFLANIWPKEHLSQLAPRACLLCEGTAFSKVVRLDAEKLKSRKMIILIRESIKL